MEEQQNKTATTRKRRIAKKRRTTLHYRTVLPLLLASVCSKFPARKALIKKCLNKIFLSLTHIDLSPILALLPSLLEFNRAEIVCKSAEIIGAASLASFEMNEQITLEDEIMRSLISLLRSSRRKVAIAACNAVLDLSTTSLGRERLLEFNAIENILQFLVEGIVSSDLTSFSVRLLQESNSKSTWLEEDDYPNLLLQEAIALINSCTIEQLQCLPTDLSRKTLELLKGLWGQAYRQRLYSSSSRSDQGIEFCGIRTNNLVESIFRLSINCGLNIEYIDVDRVKNNLFNLGEADIKPFLSEIWETSPMVIRNTSSVSLRLDGIFDHFLQCLGTKEAMPATLPSMLKCITSCPAIESDELDILHLIEEIKNHLGFPTIYDQDIRVVKTHSGGRESHYFREQLDPSFSVGLHILSINSILECEEAFRKGYSIALRGVEFRYQTIAVIADCLASFFGQPSTGVNMYLTPSNSQGLSRHSDDHCVFVCQLIGAKRWTIFPRPDFQLPRLYESSYSSEDDNCESQVHQQILLKEGDVLYIPRGFPHEAIAVVDDDEDAHDITGFSLHLTLAIEIEPPFEWEGFMQVALYSWDKKQKALHYKSEDSLQWSLHLVSIRLLRIAIKLIGNLDPVFRKACLVGAASLSSDTRDWLLENQKTTFGYLINKITSMSKFLEAVSQLEASLQKNEDPLEHIRWMKYLFVEEEATKRSKNESILSADSRYLFDLLIMHKDMAEAAFLQVKFKFCDEVEFEDVEQHYMMLLEKYRAVRKHYANGMLLLHSALRNEHEISLS